MPAKKRKVIPRQANVTNGREKILDYRQYEKKGRTSLDHVFKES